MKTAAWIMVIALGLTMGANAHQEADAFDSSFGRKSNADSVLDRIRFGSYGELHGRVGDGADNIDMHRLVAMLDVQLTSKLRLVTETEFEHVFYHEEGDGKEDFELEVEQLYLEYAYADDLLINMGIQLLPVGLVGVNHEPTTFYGVERPNVEKYIIPSSWWEGGIGITKTYDSGLQIDILAHTAMDMDDDGYIRSGRGKLDLNEYTEAKSWGLTGRVKYTGIAGVELAGTLQYQDDVSSSVSGSQNSYMAEMHAIYRKGGFELRGLAAYWNVDGFSDAEIDEQWGYYIEPSYAFETAMGKIGVFTRFSQYDYFKSGKKQNEDYTIGINYWPTEEIVFKTDYTVVDGESEDSEVWNFGIGYFF